jgi:SpoVK/Ycf46/Vps4 family AAA+-type ATPase
MIDNPNSILIIEDAESVLRDRITAKNVSVSNLLNMADGLLSDCLNVQLVCTFNTEISSIDQALLRKGRIIAKYEFKPLTIEKSNKLFKELKIKNCTRSQMTLAEIYNQTAPSFNENKFNKIGFN